MVLPAPVSVPFALIAIVGVTNAINLADGLDGLAGGIMLMSIICIGFLAYLPNDAFVLLMASALAGGIFGFLRFNTHPATVFMGDTGSQLIGFLTVVLALKLTQGPGAVSPLFPLILLGFPVLDTVTVMAERLLQGRPPFAPDKNHFHHKLMGLGLFHSEAVFAIYLIQSFLVVTALVLRFHSERLLLGFYLLFSGGIISFFHIAGQNRWRIKRYALIDHLIKGRLRDLKEKQVPIRVAFRGVQFGLPALLLFTVFVPAQLPAYVGLFALPSAIFIGIAVIWKKAWVNQGLRPALYLTIPFLLYFSQAVPADWFSSPWQQLYHLWFAAMVVLVVLTLKFTRRQKGFKATPLDFLILFIALVLPSLPNSGLQSRQLTFLAVKGLVFLFSYELLIAEQRGELNKLALMTAVTLVVVFLRSLL